ncbi:MULTISPECIES: DUF2572 family protein [unclassified Romboutsia]|uniref:DUF2572 family protein n=1 Tax=unclassified Romboutsia TaxID=2626894 RepID=UPI0008225950|nr:MULTISPECIES: DUF2572 family protein [unclassified Romboutsia]SCI38396.1 Uncharacterised protein [uncultured Clostridium sp.]
MKKNNKGSSLITVVIVLAVIFTMGTAIIGLLNVNYRIRVKENRRLQNLYASEAGIDVTYNIIANTFEYAVDEAYKKVQSDIDISEEQKNEKFKEEFKAFISNKYNSNSDNSSMYDEFKNNITNTRYIKSINSDGIRQYEEVIFDFYKSNSELNKPILIVEDTSNLDDKNNKYTLDVVSEFYTNDSTGENKRIIKLTYDVKIPEYDDVVPSISDKESLKVELQDKSIVTDGNIVFNSGVSIQGNIFALGSKESNDLELSKKYIGGIKVSNEYKNDSNTVSIKGDISTAKTFNLVKNTNVNIDGNLYAGNIYIGNGESNVFEGHNNNLKIVSSTLSNQVITNNDLVINSTGSEISIDNFYGINDLTDKTDSNAIKTSSSIIVNNNPNETTEYSNLTINNEAYIMGTAYINVKNGEDYYQTGESTAVKGNYVAYTIPLDNEKFNNVEFEYYDILQLVERYSGSDSKLSGTQKSEYFEKFAKNNKALLTHGGINFLNPNKVSAIGAIVYNKGNEVEVLKASYALEDKHIIDSKKADYAKNVFGIGSEVDYSIGTQKTVEGLIKNHDKSYVSVEEEDNQGLEDIAIIDLWSNESNKNIVITTEGGKGKITIDNSNSYYYKDENINAVIVTDSPIEIKGEVNFKGTIISTSDITFNKGKTSKTNIVYDKNIVDKIISDNYSAFESSGVLEATNSQDSTTETNIEYAYDIKRYISSRNWKLEK